MNDIEILENYLKENEELFEEIGTMSAPNNTIKQAIENLIKENKELKERLKNVKNCIENEMYVDDNPTICGDEEDTITELPISLSLYNEDLRKLLELLED